MSLEEEREQYRLKSTDEAKDTLFQKMSESKAYTKETAILVEKLNLTQEEDIAFDESVLEEEIIVFINDDKEYCYLGELYTPPKSEGKIARIPALIICLVVTITIIFIVVYQLVDWFVF